MDYMAFADGSSTGRVVRVCRTGYTGEHGYELVPAWDDAPALWDALAESVAGAAGCRLDWAPATPAYRDGLSAARQDLSPTISPVQARSSWAVGWKKDAFWGRDALLAERAAGAARTLWGVKVTAAASPVRT
jgi:aminomethyltransferase